MWTVELFHEQRHECTWGDVRFLLAQHLEPITVRWWPEGVPEPEHDDAVTSLGELLDANSEVFSLHAA